MNRQRETAEARRRAERLLERYEARHGGEEIGVWYLADIGRLLRIHRDTVRRRYAGILWKFGARWGAEREDLLAVLEGGGRALARRVA